MKSKYTLHDSPIGETAILTKGESGDWQVVPVHPHNTLPTGKVSDMTAYEQAVILTALVKAVLGNKCSAVYPEHVGEPFTVISPMTVKAANYVDSLVPLFEALKKVLTKTSVFVMTPSWLKKPTW